MNRESEKPRMWGTGSCVRLILLCVLLAAGYFFWADHEVHIFGWLPYILLLLCLLLHLLMYRGHGGHHGGHEHRSERKRGSEPLGE